MIVSGKHAMIGRITGTMLGLMDRGVYTSTIYLTFASGSQGAGGYQLSRLDGTKHVPTENMGRFVAGILCAAGVDEWEKVRGRTVLALFDDADCRGRIVGLAPLPTEPGEPFLFSELERRS